MTVDRELVRPSSSRDFARLSVVDFLQATAAKDGVIEATALDIPRRISILVATFDEQPVISSAGLLFHFDQRESAAQFLAQQRNVNLASSQLLLWRLILKWLIFS